MTSVEDIVHHYQKSIEKASNDEKRLLHCLNKLCKLPVTVQHLQETGIGRTVNSLRKFDGEVGAKAKALVTKWKEMVAAEESSENEAEESEKSDDDNINSDRDDVEPDSSPENRKSQTIEVKIKKELDEPHHSSDTHNHQYNEEKPSHRKEVKHKENISTQSELHIDRDLNDIEHKLKHQHHSSTSKSSSHSKSHTKINTKSSNGHQSSSSSKDKPRDNENHSHSSHKHEKSTSSHISNSKRKREDSLSDKLSDIEDNKLVIDDEKSKSTKKGKSDHKSSTSSSSNHHHSSSSSKHREHSKSKEHGSSSSSHRKSKHEKIRKDNDDEHLKEKSSSGHQQNGENIIKHSREASPQQNDVKQNRIEKSGKEKRNKTVEAESKTYDSNKTVKKRVHGSDDEKDGDGIDQSTGASFAEALGMLEPVSSKKTPKKKTQSPTQSKQDKFQSSTPSSSLTTSSKSLKPSSSKPSSSKCLTPSVLSTPSSSSTPLLLAPSVKLRPLEAELSLDLVPTISNNYKPMPLNPIVMDCVFFNNKPQKKFMTDEEAFGASISSKTMRTKVYSGTKSSITVVPPLLELCIRILQKNIDALEYTGGVPFDILKPILDRASAEQLFNFEHYNPYLMDDSDVLWQGHCNRRFKGKKRLEMETWREMFIRCLEEQESKLASLTENIKKTQVQSVPVKQTKLAYIDSTAKAPRNIRNKQIQFGTDRKLITTPAARVAALSNITSNIGQVGDSRLKVAAGSRDFAQVQGSSSKPRKAPLMAKAMQLMKGRFKR